MHFVSHYGILQVVWVPGSFEIPVVTQGLAMTKKYDSILTIGAVVSLTFFYLFTDPTNVQLSHPGLLILIRILPVCFFFS